MNLLLRSLLVAGTLTWGLSAAAATKSAPGSARIAATYVLGRLSLSALAPTNGPTYDLERAKRNGMQYTDLPSLGSGIARNKQGEWFGLTDCGPGIHAQIKGIKGTQHVRLLPEFAPSIARFELRDGRIVPVQFIALRDSQGRPLTGLQNLRTDAPYYGSLKADRPLAPDPGGVDPEAIRCRPDGGFVLGEEHAPSVLLVDRSGRVESRLTPSGRTLDGASYPVKPILPEVFGHRRTNRGFESVALSPDGRTAYALLQSPVVDERDPLSSERRVVRVVELDLSDLANPRVRGHYLMLAGSLAEHPGTQRQDQVKLNDAEWLAPGCVLVLEQARNTAALRIVDLREATNLLGRTNENDRLLDTVGTDLAALGIHLASTTLFCRLDRVSKAASHKLEGLCLLGPDRVAVSNDNDFGVGDKDAGMPTMVWLLTLPKPLPIAIPSP